MKSLKIIITSISALLLAAACNKSEVPGEGASIVLDYSVSVPSPATKAIGDGCNVDKMVYAIYDDDKEVVSETVIDRSSEGTFSFQPSLYYGKTYTVAMFAFADGAYNVKDITAIKKSKDDQTSDAFAHTETVMIDQDGALYINGIKSSETTVSHSVTLTRPVAQLAIVTTSYSALESIGAKSIRITVGSDKHPYSAGSFNALDHKVSSGATSYTYVTSVDNLGKVGNEDNYIVSCNYLFSMSGLVDLKIEVLDNNGDEIRIIDLENVSLQTNKKTNIQGNLVQGTLEFSVTLITTFDKNEDGIDNEKIIDNQ